MNEQYGTARDEVYEGRALVAVFGDRDAARGAAKQLHDEGFRRTWIGVTGRSDRPSAERADTGRRTMVETDAETLGEKIGRFFSGESGDRTLYRELVRHGVAEPEARRLDGALQPNCAILTVDGSNHPEMAARILESAAGQIIAGEAFATSGMASSSEQAPSGEMMRGSSVLGYGDAAQYARGEQIDEARRLHLREERLNVEKQRVSGGEVNVGKEVVEHPQEIDVPTIREELFIERMSAPAEARTTEAAGPIGESEAITIPLMREQVIVTKRPVVTGEYVVGKRQVSDSEHVSETTREERLTVNDRSQAGKAAGSGSAGAPDADTRT